MPTARFACLALRREPERSEPEFHQVRGGRQGSVLCGSNVRYAGSVRAARVTNRVDPAESQLHAGKRNDIRQEPVFSAIRAALRESEVEQSAPTWLRRIREHSERNYFKRGWRKDNRRCLNVRSQRNRVPGQVYRYILPGGTQQDQPTRQ